MTGVESSSRRRVFLDPAEGSSPRERDPELLPLPRRLLQPESTGPHKRDPGSDSPSFEVTLREENHYRLLVLVWGHMYEQYT